MVFENETENEKGNIVCDDGMDMDVKICGIGIGKEGGYCK